MPDQDESVKFIRKTQLELRLSRYRRQAFGKHTHDTYSIGVVCNGRTRFLHRNQTQAIGPGTLALINPDEVHACNPEKDSTLAYSMFYIKPSLIREIAAALAGHTVGSAYFAQPVVENRRLFLDFCHLSSLIAQDASPLEIEVRLVEALACVLQHYGDVRQRSARRNANRDVIEAGRVFLLENLAENVSLEEVAAYSGLSPYHFLREFRKHYGLPPHTYQLQQRVNVAKNLLYRGQSITEVAAAVGFADQSHFTRKFKVFVGATPRQYQLAQR